MTDIKKVLTELLRVIDPSCEVTVTSDEVVSLIPYICKPLLIAAGLKLSVKRAHTPERCLRLVHLTLGKPAGSGYLVEHLHGCLDYVPTLVKHAEAVMSQSPVDVNSILKLRGAFSEPISVTESGLTYSVPSHVIGIRTTLLVARSGMHVGVGYSIDDTLGYRDFEKASHALGLINFLHSSIVSATMKRRYIAMTKGEDSNRTHACARRLVCLMGASPATAATNVLTIVPSAHGLKPHALAHGCVMVISLIDIANEHCKYATIWIHHQDGSVDKTELSIFALLESLFP